MKGWFDAHVYTATLIGAGAFVVIVVTLVAQRAPASLNTNPTIATIDSGQVVSPIAQPYNTVPVGVTLPQGSTTLQGGVNTSINATGPTGDTLKNKQSRLLLRSANSGTDADVRAMLAMLTNSNPNAVSTATWTATIDTSVYAFIPKTLVSRDQTPDLQSLAPAQQELRRYGNEVGSYVQTYEQLHHNDYIAVQNYFRDPQNSAKQTAVINLAQAIRGVGLSMQHMDSVPTSVKALHDALAQSYVDAGSALGAQVSVQGDSAILTSINAYNAAVKTYVKKYAALALFFSLNNVTFQKDEPGSEFMFTP